MHDEQSEQTQQSQHEWLSAPTRGTRGRSISPRPSCGTRPRSAADADIHDASSPPWSRRTATDASMTSAVLRPEHQQQPPTPPLSPSSPRPIELQSSERPEQQQQQQQPQPRLATSDEKFGELDRILFGRRADGRSWVQKQQQQQAQSVAVPHSTSAPELHVQRTSVPTVTKRQSLQECSKGAGDSCDESAAQRQRAAVLRELLDSERDYVLDLQFVVERYLLPLQMRRLLPEQVLDEMFSNVATIAKTNQSILSEMEAGVRSVQEIFLDSAPRMRCYTTFCNISKKAADTVKAYLSKDVVFARFCEEVRSDAACRQRQLDAFLIKPVQRICKYPLLFRELLKATPLSHPEHKSCQEAVLVMSDLAAYVNRCRMQFERMLEIQDTIEGAEALQLADPERLLEIVGEVGLESMECMRIFFLFTDMLLLAKKNKFGKKYRLKHAIYLDEQTKISMVEGQTIYRNAVELTEHSKWGTEIAVHTLLFSTPEESFVLLNALTRQREQLISALASSEKVSRRENVELSNDRNSRTSAKRSPTHAVRIELPSPRRQPESSSNKRSDRALQPLHTALVDQRRDVECLRVKLAILSRGAENLRSELRNLTARFGLQAIDDALRAVGLDAHQLLGDTLPPA